MTSRQPCSAAALLASARDDPRTTECERDPGRDPPRRRRPARSRKRRCALSAGRERAFADTYDTLVRVVELDVARDLLSSVRDFLQSKIAETQSEIVKKLTVVASLVLVPTLITGFYGQNFTGVFDESYWTLTVSIGLIVGTTLAQLAFFRWKRWL